MKNFKHLGRQLSVAEKRMIFGGDDPIGSLGGDDSSCTANCADGTTVTCEGSGCTAVDNDGCAGPKGSSDVKHCKK